MLGAKKILVEIPCDKGIHIKSAGTKGEKYVYRRVEYYRNAEGNPRNKSKLIGKLDGATGKMRPNGNYFEMYQIDALLPEVAVWDYGYSYLVEKVCRDMGLYECLEKAFGGRVAMEIVVMSAYMIREGNAMDGIDDWQSRNYFNGMGRMLNSQACSRTFGSLTHAQRDVFFREWGWAGRW